MNVDKIELQLTEDDGRPLKRKWEIGEILEMDGQYTILVKGQVFSKQDKSNNDGTVNLLIKICPSDLQVITDNIKSKL